LPSKYNRLGQFFKRIRLKILEGDPNGMYHGVNVSELGCKNGTKCTNAIPIYGLTGILFFMGIHGKNIA